MSPDRAALLAVIAAAVATVAAIGALAWTSCALWRHWFPVSPTR